MHDFKPILARIRNYEIRLRKAIHAQMRGSFDSIFKGTGLDFDDVRAYQYGDDVRRIDWHVSAKGEDTYIKVFKEEKEQIVFFVLDVSASHTLGSSTQTKAELGRDIASVLALSAVKEESEVGLLAYSDQKEKYIKPDRGMRKAYEVMLNLFRLQPQSPRTDIGGAMRFTLNLLKRRGIVIFISDFVGEGWQEPCKALARKHDLIIIHLADPRDRQLPNLGLIPVWDTETQITRWVNTASRKFQADYQRRFEEQKQEITALCQQYQIDYQMVYTGEDFVPDLIKLFKVRNLAGRSIAP